MRIAITSSALGELVPAGTMPGTPNTLFTWAAMLAGQSSVEAFSSSDSMATSTLGEAPQWTRAGKQQATEPTADQRKSVCTDCSGCCDRRPGHPAQPEPPPASWAIPQRRGRYSSWPCRVKQAATQTSATLRRRRLACPASSVSAKRRTRQMPPRSALPTLAASPSRCGATTSHCTRYASKPILWPARAMLQGCWRARP
jgi:hypothetical protein